MKLDSGSLPGEPSKRAKPAGFAVKVTGLSPTVPESWLQSTFGNYGPVIRTEVGDRRLQDTVYVHFATHEAAQAACKEMDGETVAGSVLHVELYDEDTHSQPYSSNFQSPSVASGANTTATTENLHSIKLTNIPLSVTEAGLVEKCSSLKGFASLRLVKVKDASTNYALVNISSAFSDSAQQALDAMTLDGSTVRASQPKPHSSCEVETGTEKGPQLSRKFSFKLSDDMSTTALPSSGLPAHSTMIDMGNLPCLPSGSKSLFQPVGGGGLKLSDEHSAMLSSFPVAHTDHPVPLQSQTIDSRPSDPHQVYSKPPQPHKGNSPPSIFQRGASTLSHTHQGASTPSHSPKGAPSHTHKGVSTPPHSPKGAPSHTHKGVSTPPDSPKGASTLSPTHKVDSGTLKTVVGGTDKLPTSVYGAKPNVKLPVTKKTTSHTTLTVKDSAMLASHHNMLKSSKSHLKNAKTSANKNLSSPPSLKQSNTQPMMLSEAVLLMRKEKSEENSEAKLSSISRSPTMKRSQTAPSASVLVIQDPVSPTKISGPQTREVSPSKLQEVSPSKVREVSPSKFREVSPSKVREVSPSKFGEVSPSKVREVKLREVSPSKFDSDINPFKQALADIATTASHTDKPPARPQLTQPKKKLTVVTDMVECSHLTSKRILLSKYSSELTAIQEQCRVVVRGKDVEGTLVSVCGDRENVDLAKRKISALEWRVSASVSPRIFTVSCALLPCLADPDVVKSLQSIEKQDAVDFSIVTVNSHINLSECSKVLSDKLAETKGPLCLSQVQGLAEMRLGYFWKVRSATTGQIVGFEPGTNDKINAAYVKRASTCIFEYQGHSYTLDFIQMTVTDHTKRGELHSLLKEPVWSRYIDDEFGYNPLRPAICAIIESTFQQGASGLIDIEGQQCVVDFTSAPMHVHSISGESCAIQRQPEMEVSSLEPVVTVRVRGMGEQLASAEREFRQTLERKITTETLTVPESIQNKFTQLLLLCIARQYCVQCAPHEADPLVLNLSGTKEMVVNVHRLLLQETMKIMSKSDTPTGQSTALPPNWIPQDSEVQLCPVEKGTSEWTHIEELMRESLPRVRIDNIKRIQNKYLWQKYNFFRRAMKKKMNGEDINEKELFHGTRSNDPKMIYESEKGFDFRFGSSDCMWGQGSYFAVKASYSDNGYAYRGLGDKKQLILARVVTGESKFMDRREKLSVPPLKPGSTNERYDTVRANTGGSEIYVVYDHEKAYPAYLISYSTS